jgi:hypothetical protein
MGTFAPGCATRVLCAIKRLDFPPIFFPKNTEKKYVGFLR